MRAFYLAYREIFQTASGKSAGGNRANRRAAKPPRLRKKFNTFLRGEQAVMAKVETILEEIKGLTLLEASDLVKKMEEAFGVSAAAAQTRPRKSI